MLKLSIVIPVYNAAKFVGRCIDSCINQTYKNVEIICIDDCSTDNSKEILESFQKKDDRIKCVFHSKNESQYIARRNGFLKATGDYILFIDSDDMLRLDACNLIAQKVEKEYADIIQFGYKEIPRGKNIFPPFYPSSRERIQKYLAKENRYSPMVWNKAYHYSVISKAFNIMEIFYASGPEDVYTSIVFAYCAETFALIKKTLVNYSVDTGWSRKKEYSLEIYASWLSSYSAVIQKTSAFISRYIPEFSEKCFDMELYLLKDFLYNRLAPDISPELRYRFFEILPSYFSKNVIYAFIEEAVFKSHKYNTYLDFNVSFKSRTKKILLIFLLYFKSLFKLSFMNIPKRF